MNGEICHDVCAAEDDLVIYHYYNALCRTPQTTPSPPPTPTATPTAAPGPSGVADPGETAAPGPTESNHDGSEKDGTW